MAASLAEDKDNPEVLLSTQRTQSTQSAQPVEQTPKRGMIKSTKSTKWTNEPDSNISRPKQVQSKKLPKVVVWKDLSVWVPVESKSWFAKKKSHMRCVLKNVSGVAEAGQILAIMGESGAGKTTLINVLTQRFKKSLLIEGEVNVNGQILHPVEMQKISAFVQQFDVFFGSQTVREHLLFCAHLRMGADVSSDDKAKKVDEVIERMGLVDCQHTLISQDSTKSISLGEKKRLSFAAELLNDPLIIFCDEPTSGLDAFMARQVISCLKNLATESGCTVIITIHQPSSQIFQIIDRVCFMTNGHVCYFGPTKKVNAFLGSIGYQMPVYTNPAEFAIKTLSIRSDEDEDGYRVRIGKIARAYKGSALASDVHFRTHGPVSERRLISNDDLATMLEYNASWFVQFWWLFKRAFFKSLRDPLMIRIRLCQILLTVTFISLVYFDTRINKDTVMNADGFLFKATRDFYFLYMFPCITVFSEELPALLRETHDRVYRTSAYYVAKNLAELPQYLVLPTLYSIALFFTTGVMDSQQDYDYIKLLIFILIGCTSTTLSLSIGYAASCMFSSPEIAVQFLPMINLPLLASAGFFVNISTLKDYFKPLPYISWFRYTFESVMINVWSGRGEIPGCASEGKDAICMGHDGGSHLRELGLHSEHHWIWINLSILIGMIFLIRTLGLMALIIRNRIKDG